MSNRSRLVGIIIILIFFLTVWNTNLEFGWLKPFNPVNKFLVSKETVLPHQWESEAWKFGFIKRVDKGQFTTLKDLKSWCFEGLVRVKFCSDKGLLLKTSACQICHSCNNWTFINSFDKTKSSSFNPMVWVRQNGPLWIALSVLKLFMPDWEYYVIV